MDPTLLALRWAHVLAAIVAMGGLVFARFALVPALEAEEPATRDRIHDAIRRRWLPWVIAAITLLLASGLANFILFNARVKEEGWANGAWMRQTSYHAVFGVKFLLALAVFYFASGLVGRGAGTQWIRNARARWLSVTLVLALGIVLLCGWMRQLHTGPNGGGEDGGVRIDAAAGRPATDDSDTRYRDGTAGSAFRRSDGETAPAPTE